MPPGVVPGGNRKTRSLSKVAGFLLLCKFIKESNLFASQEELQHQ